MESVSDIWGLAADKWDEVMAQVGEADMATSTTCDGWSVQDLVDHAMGWQGRGGAAFGVEAADWAERKPALKAALADPANLEGTVEAFGGMPKQAVAGLLTTDLLVHAWDLARSVGADETLPDAAVQSALMGLQRLPEPMLRSENMFGAAVEVPEDAIAQDRLIAFVGRQP